MWQHVCLQVDCCDEMICAAETIKALGYRALVDFGLLSQSSQDSRQVSLQCGGCQLLRQPAGVFLLPEKYFSHEIKAINKESSSAVHNNSHTFCYMITYMYIFL